MSDSLYETYQHYGTNAERIAFVPDPPVVTGCQPIYIWYETDTDNVYAYDTGWHLIVNASPTIPNTIDPFLLMGA